MKDFGTFRALVREILLEFLDDAQILSQYAHRGQKRRTGEPYFFHPQEVANLIKKYYPNDQAAYYAALLHDAIEDGIPQGNIEDEDEFFAFLSDTVNDDVLVNDVFNAITKLTKPDGADYIAYIDSILGDRIALRVKIADMIHNLSDFPSPRQRKKYLNVFDQLSAGGKPSAISPAHWKAFEEMVKNADG